MNIEEALERIGYVLVKYAHTSSEDWLAITTIREAIESKKSERRTLLELCLAYYIGALHEEDDGLLETIPLMSDEELDRKIAMKGELVDWE